MNRWVRCWSSLAPPVKEALRELRSLPDSYIFDNIYLQEPGPTKLKPEDAVKVLHLVHKAREDTKGMTEEAFKTSICSPMLAKAAWVKSMRNMFGKMVEAPVPGHSLALI